jgi:hypothetical protein
MPDAGVSFFLPRVVGLGRAMEMSMLGDAVDAEEAYRIGLVGRVVPDEWLEEETAALASRLTAMPTRALGGIKQALYASFDSDLDTALEREAVGQTLCGRTADHEEGTAVVFEKREPELHRALETTKPSFWQNGGVKIREAVEEDLPAIVEIYNSTVPSRSPSRAGAPGSASTTRRADPFGWRRRTGR